MQKQGLIFYIRTLMISIALSCCVVVFPKNVSLASAIVYSQPWAHEGNPLIHATEWQELGMDDVVKYLDNTITSFGMTGLKRLLIPLDNILLVRERHTLIERLLTDDALYAHVKKLLQSFASHEEDLMAYFDLEDAVIAAGRSFYWSTCLLPARVKNALNRSSWALQGSLSMTALSSVGNFMRLLCLQGIGAGLTSWFLNKNKSFMSVFTHGLEEPFLEHQWTTTKDFSQNTPAHGWGLRDFAKAFTNGSLGDRIRLMHEGYSFTLSDYCNLPGRITQRLGLSSATRVSTHLPYIAAVGVGLANTVFYDMRRVQDIMDAYTTVKNRYTILQSLKKRTTHVAQCVHTAQKLQTLVGALAFLPPVIDTMGELVPLLKVVLQKPWFWQGSVLHVHRLLCQHKNRLVQLCRFVAQIDAIMAVTTFIKQARDKGLPCSSVVFDAQNDAGISLVDCWSPLVVAAVPVTNSVMLGTAGHASRGIITGPNGCGKSAVIKAIGHSVMLAHSCGIALSSSATMPFLCGLRTSICVKEDMRNKLSTYMAVAQSMDRIQKFVSSCTDERKGLVLLDEPYHGTIEAESASRITQFALSSASYPSCMICMAIHVAQPTMLASEYPTLFANYQIEVQDDGAHNFTRTFKLLPGAAHWWFNDEKRRKRFIDWIEQQAL